MMSKIISKRKKHKSHISYIPKDITKTIILYLDVEQIPPFFETYNLNPQMEFRYDMSFYKNNGNSYYGFKLDIMSTNGSCTKYWDYQRLQYTYAKYIFDKYPNVMLTGTCVKYVNESLMHLSSHTKSLTLMNLKYRDFIIPPYLNELKHLVMNRVKSLIFLNDILNLHYICINNGMNLEGLTQCHNLQHLELDRCDLSVLPSLTNKLRILKIKNCDNLVNISRLSTCRNMRKIMLIYCRILKDVSSLGACTKLRRFNAKSCSLMDVSCLSNCEELLVFNIWNSNEITVLPIMNLNIKYIRVSNCKNIVNYNTLSLYKNLDFLEIAYSHHLVTMPKLECAKLTTILLVGCDKLIDITGLASCVNLKYVVIRCCDLLQNLHGLTCRPEIVNLIGCDKLTDMTDLHCSNIKNIMFVPGENINFKKKRMRTLISARRSMGKTLRMASNIFSGNGGFDKVNHVPEEVRGHMI